MIDCQKDIINNQKNEINKLNKANEVEIIDVDNNNNITCIIPQRGTKSKKRKRFTMMVELDKNRKRYKEVKTEKIAIQSQLNEVQEDLVDERELLGMQTQTTDIWQGRFDKVYEK